jgi:hypothetical protein
MHLDLPLAVAAAAVAAAAEAEAALGRRRRADWAVRAWGRRIALCRVQMVKSGSCVSFFFSVVLFPSAGEVCYLRVFGGYFVTKELVG